MQVTIHLFAAAAELAQSRHVQLDVPDQADLTQIADELAGRLPQLTSLIRISRWAVDHEFVPLSTTVEPQQELALIPPVSGG